MISAFWGMHLYSQSWGAWSSSNPFQEYHFLDYQAEGCGLKNASWAESHSLCWSDGYACSECPTT